MNIQKPDNPFPESPLNGNFGPFMFHNSNTYFHNSEPSTHENFSQFSEDYDASCYNNNHPLENNDFCKLVYQFEKENVFGNPHLYQHKLLNANQTSYSTNKSRFAINQESSVAFLLIDTQNNETFFQQVIRSKNEIISSCSFFLGNCDSLICYSNLNSSVNVFDFEMYKTVLTFPENSNIVQTSESNILSFNKLKKSVSLFDIRTSKSILSLSLSSSNQDCFCFGLQKSEHKIMLSTQSGLFYGDIRKPLSLDDGFCFQEFIKSSNSETPVNSKFCDLISFNKIEFLTNEKLLIVDMSDSTLMIYNFRSNEKTAQVLEGQLILDFTIIPDNESVIILCESLVNHSQKLLLFDYDLNELKEIRLNKKSMNMIGFFRNSPHLLVNSLNEFLVLEMIDDCFN